MIIGIDASKAATKNRTGVENFVYQLILHLKKIDHKNLYFLYTNKKLPRELTSQTNMVERYLPAPRFWNKIFLSFLLLRFRPDVYLQPADMVPWSAPKRSAAVIHDLAYKFFPDAYSPLQQIVQRETLKQEIRRAKKIICVSQSTGNDLNKLFKVSPKPVVVPLGYNTALFKEIARPRDVLKIDAPYILTTGRLEERKNTKRLIEAFIKLKSSRKIPHKLVLIGYPGHNFDQIYSTIKASEFEKDIIMTGHIQHEKLPEIIARADVFAFPTLYEGFGLPALEAMACGCPVVTSNASSMPEVVGDAALQVDPLKIDDIADAIYKIISDLKLKQELIAAGLIQCQKYTWDKTAAAFLKEMETI